MDMLIPELVSITPAGAFPLLQCSSAQESVVFSNPVGPCTGSMQAFDSTDHLEDSSFHP